MNRIEGVFRRLHREGRGALIPFLMAGDPDPDASFATATTVIGAGADILELGIPFSDPAADGPVIQRAGARALAAGMTVERVMALVHRLRARHDIPLVLMTYYNPVFRHGEDRFIAAAVAAGADGLIVVDLPPEEGKGFFRRSRRAGLAPILMVTPTTPPQRERMILGLARGFVYVVSRPGTTGARADLPAELREKVARLRGTTSLPVAIGFGISSAAQVAEVLSYADGAIVGSALVAAIERGEAAGDSIRAMKQPVIASPEGF